MAKHAGEYFIWRYQTQFQAVAQIEAESLLGKLDARFNQLKPRVFLVGVLAKPRPDRHPICVVPANCPYQPATFAGLGELAAQLEASDSEKHLFHSHPVAHEYARRATKLRYLRGAVRRKIEEATRDEGAVTFLSWLKPVDDYWVVVVLQLSRPVYDSHYRLTKDAAGGCGAAPFAVSVSLLEAAIGEYLRACAEHLHKPDPGAFPRIIEDFTEALRAAAKRLMDAPTLAGGNRHGMHGLYEACNAISTLKYEGTEGVGRLVLARPDHPDVGVALKLISPVPLRDYGAVRKLLQLATGEMCLLCDSAEVYGLGGVRDSYDPSREDIFVVRFTKNFMWDLSHAGNTMMHLRYGEPHARLAGFPSELFLRDLPRVFAGITSEQAVELCDLARSVASQEHGAMLVVSSAAGEEAARLANEATCVRPFPLRDPVIPLVTAIDGAVLVDLDGVCHAIGVILDGLAHPHCTPSRGARYNSAVRYAYGRHDCMVVVKSEDGMVNLFPELRPQIRRSALHETIGRLRAVANAAVADPAELYQVMNWVHDHRFYLSASECEEVNRLSEAAAGRLPSGESRFVYDRFAPDPEMNDTYFLTE